ncbi:MAG: putative ABC transporter ATP-binding protein YbhF [Planctomycetes bacterium ADurb.Bin126]|nr:MAG: putative ABC transporter ATP-binding protein YbhF [Planctomycetes bacterium ADurb.Bin126]HOD81995.1 ABC transporter ATP-binding protein [Phycisphaerae bacterium]HQL74257.1 ABC transporter ATP-binding protein [Phycisphaerae bacterium]
MIDIKRLTKYYGNLGALVDLDLQIAEGDIFGFIGPNGAGKTTTMRILATLLQPTRGQAFINGVDVLREGKKVRRLVGYMPDFMGVYDDLKVFEYLEFFAAAFGIERSKRKAVIDGVLELTDLAGKRTTAVDNLSRGMQQRLGLARVLIHDPKALILDEPASGLDPRARIEMRVLLRELKQMGKTIMISSHILSELEEMCDQVGIIEHGKLVFQGTIEDIRSRMGVSSKLRVRVAADPARAAEVLMALPAVREVTQQGDQLLVILQDGQAANALIARTLVQHEFDLVSLVPEQIKLDEAFLQLTKGLVQ